MWNGNLKKEGVVGGGRISEWGRKDDVAGIERN